MANLDAVTGDELRQWRRSLGLTQRQQGALLGVSRDTVAAWETGRGACRGPAARLLRTVWWLLQHTEQAGCVGALRELGLEVRVGQGPTRWGVPVQQSKRDE